MTDTKMRTRTEQILRVMPILAWVAFIGYLIEAGAILFSYGVSWLKPEAAGNLYRGLDLFELREFDFWYYTQSVSLFASLAILKAWVSFLVIKTLSKFNLSNPFTMEVAVRLEQVSYMAFGTWVVTMVSNAHTGWLMKLTGQVHGTWHSGEFIFMVALVFIVSQVFKRGVEIQSENELTV